MGKIERKRFIAGATCPSCAAVDKLYTCLQDGEQWRACASCDFRESYSQFSARAAAAQELPTRVNQPRPGEDVLAHETPVETVTIIDPAKPGPGKR